MALRKILLGLGIFLLLMVNVSAETDVFQYHPSADLTQSWANESLAVPWTKGGTGGHTATIQTYNTTQKRAVVSVVLGGGYSYYFDCWLTSPYVNSTYFSYVGSVATNGGNSWSRLYIYNEAGILQYTISIPVASVAKHEYILSLGQLYSRVDGVQTIVGAFSGNYIGCVTFYVRAGNTASLINRYTYIYVEDFTTSNSIGIGHDHHASYDNSHQIIKSIVYTPTNYLETTYSLRAILEDYTASEYKMKVRNTVTGLIIDERIIKPAGISETSTVNKTFGSVIHNLTLLFGANYVTYDFFITKNDAYLVGDYVTYNYVPISSTSTIDIADVVYVGASSPITYFIDGYDSAAYNYAVKIYDNQWSLMDTKALSAASGTVYWTPTLSGRHYVILRATEKTAGTVYDLAYDITTVVETVQIKGTTLNATSGAALGDVFVNVLQAGVWSNTTSNATGNYSISGLNLNQEMIINASLENYTHVAFAMTPTVSGEHTVNLYLYPTNITRDTTAIQGYVLSSLWYQGIGGATVNIWNGTWSANTTANSLGYYLFDNLEPAETYYLNATKPGYVMAGNYLVSTTLNEWAIQNIILNPIFILTIKARDAVTASSLSSFTSCIAEVCTNTTTSSVVYNLNYGTYTVTVSADNYFSTTRDIVLTYDRTEIFDLIPMSTGTTTTTIIYDPNHAVKFIVTSYNGTVYSGVDVTSTVAGNSTSGTTGTDGGAVFWMNKTIQYNLTFIKTSQGINLTWSGYPTDTTYYVYIEGSVTFVPGNVTNTTLTNFTTKYTNETWSIQNITATYLTSDLGIGPTAQGILIASVNYVIVGAAGPVGVVLAMVIMALLGFISWAMVLFIAMTILSLHILIGGIGQSW